MEWNMTMVREKKPCNNDDIVYVYALWTNGKKSVGFKIDYEYC